MPPKVEITDKASDILKQMLKLNSGATNEALGKAGTMLKSKMMDKARSYAMLETGSKIENERRRLISSDKGGKKIPFLRYSHKSGLRASGAASMANLILNRVYEKSHKLLIGYGASGSYSPTIYRNGVAVAKGVKISGTAKEFKDIGTKFERGLTQDLSVKQRQFFKASGWAKASKTGRVTYKARPIVFNTFKMQKRAVLDIFSNEYVAVLLKGAK